MPRDAEHMGGASAVVDTTEGRTYNRRLDNLSSERPTLTEGLRRRPSPREASARGAVLLRTDRRGCGQLVALPTATTRLGRSFEADAHVDDEGVSRLHAQLSVDEGRFVIRDLGSRNGTYVDDEQVDSAVLSDGNVVRLGTRVTFRFSLVGEDERQALHTLHELGHYDPLTRVYNRRYLDHRLVAELAFAERHGASIALVLLDIDNFKAINDEHGHLVGDQVLERVASIAQAEVRTEDVVARYGGEEFIIVLRATPVAGAEALAERVRHAVAEAAIELAGGGRLAVTLSAGCASLACAGGGTPNDLIRLADRRLYLAKHEGKNRVVGGGRAMTLVPPPPEDAGAAPPTVLDELEPESKIQLVSDMARAFESLPERLRVIVGLRFQENCGLGEIAAIIDVPEPEVQRLYAEAMRRLREFAA